MGDSKTRSVEIAILLKNKKPAKALEKLRKVLRRKPRKLNLLKLAIKACRELLDFEGSLGYSEKIIRFYPAKWCGYCYAAEDLCSLNRIEEAKSKIHEGLGKFPGQFNLLRIAINVYRASGNLTQSLEYSQLLISHYPSGWQGYGCSARNLMALMRFDEAKLMLETALSIVPPNQNLFSVSIDIYRSLNMHEKALYYSAMFLKYFPNNLRAWSGLACGFIDLNQFNEACEILTKGLAKFPNDPSLLAESARISFLRKRPVKVALPVEFDSFDMFKQYILPIDFFAKLSIGNSRLACKTLNETHELKANTVLLLFKNALVQSPYGVHDAFGNPFWHSFLSRGPLQSARDYPLGIPFHLDSNRIKATKYLRIAFYVNYLNFNHFGHLLTETISSISALLHIQKDICSWPSSLPIIVPQRASADAINNLANILNINPSAILKSGDEPLRVQCLLASAPTLVDRRFSYARHQEAVQQYLASFLSRNSPRPFEGLLGQKVYISRSQLPAAKRLLHGESAIETILEQNGWTIFHPQAYDLKTQIDVYENAVYICSTNSSSLHLLYGIRIHNLQKVVMLSQMPVNNFTRQFDCQHIPFVNIQCLEPLLTCTKDGVNRDLVLRERFTPENVAQQICGECI